MAGQGGPGKPRTGRPRTDKNPDYRITALKAPGKILAQLQAAKIPYYEAFLVGAKLKLSEPNNRSLDDVERELKLLDLAYYDILEKKDKLLKERELLILEAIKEAETQQEALE